MIKSKAGRFIDTKRSESMCFRMPCRLGLHMQTAAGLVKFVRQFHSDIQIRKGRLKVDAKSILGLLTLGASWNSKLCLEIKGPNAQETFKKIESYFDDTRNCRDTMIEGRSKMQAYTCPVCDAKVPRDLLLYIDHTEMHIIDEIKRLHPEWVEANGVCNKCFEYYDKQLNYQGD